MYLRWKINDDMTPLVSSGGENTVCGVLKFLTFAKNSQFCINQGDVDAVNIWIGAVSIENG